MIGCVSVCGGVVKSLDGPRDWWPGLSSSSLETSASAAVLAVVATSQLPRGVITPAKEIAVLVRVRTVIEWSTCGTCAPTCDFQVNVVHLCLEAVADLARTG